MSGGSYNYLCYNDAEDILNKQADIAVMRDRLIGLGFSDAAKETETILLISDQYTVRMEARLERLNGIWHAVEWMDSNDSGIEEVEKEIKKYREE